MFIVQSRPTAQNNQKTNIYILREPTFFSTSLVFDLFFSPNLTSYLTFWSCNLLLLLKVIFCVFLSCPVQLWSSAVGNPLLARDIHRQFASRGGSLCRRLSVSSWSRLAFSSSQKNEKEDADKDEEDEKAGHPAQQGLQGDGVKARLGTHLWFGSAICHLSKWGGKARWTPKKGGSSIEQAGAAFQFKGISS